MKPLCELCGERHDGHQAHVWPVNKDQVVNSVNSVNTVNADVVNDVNTVNSVNKEQEKQDKRRKYMREYMARRRKKISS